jgi:predicted CXXCH cytochrome family protein
VRTWTVVIAVLLGASCRAPAGSVATGAAPALETRSNILRADYVGSAACAGCHADVYARWAASPMRNMTRNPEHAAIRAPFAGETFTFKGDQATFFRAGSARLVRIAVRDESEHLYRVTRVIGNRHREDFAGVEVASPDDSVERGTGPELILPVTYYFQTHGYRPKGYSVMAHERPGLRSGAVWNQTCVFCHNTAPWFDTVWGALAGSPAPAYQGVVVDRLLPPTRQLAYRVKLDRAFRTAIAAEESLVGVTSQPSPPDNEAAARAGIVAFAQNFVGRHLVEEGIGCEACHGGGREHAARPAVQPSYDPHSDLLEVRTQAGGTPSRALLINRTCARCHQVLFSRYPYTWEGGLRHGPAPGGSVTTSGEARDFMLGGPGKSLACTACHDPHALDQPEALARLATPAGNVVCAKCHPGLASAEGLAGHAHHLPTGPGGSCVGCHMPRKNMGLDYALTRYHRIGSPTDRERVEGDRPLECALCHADKSVASLLDTMEHWWGKKYDRRRLLALYGDLEANTLLATLARGRPHEQVAAAMVLADNKVTAAAPEVARVLGSPYPLARRFAAQALTALLREPCTIDVDASREDIRKVLAACGLDVAELPAASAPPGHPAQSGDED